VSSPLQVTGIESLQVVPIHDTWLEGIQTFADYILVRRSRISIYLWRSPVTTAQGDW
jgi:hypothetical protein